VTDPGASSSVAPSRRAPWPLHPPLFAAVVVIGFWFATAVSPYAVARSLFVAVVIAIALTALGALVFRSWQLGGIAASAVIGLLWSKDLIDEIGSLAARMGWVSVLWIAAIAAAVVLVARAVRRRRLAFTRASVTSMLNRVAALLFAATVLLGFLTGRFADAVSDLDQGVDLAAWSATDGDTRPSGSPDIFVILLDGYPRADALEWAFEIDNSGFTDALAERGFQVATQSHSNYLWTHLTLPSMLNQRYVEQIPAMVEVQEGRAPRQPTLRRTVSNNPVFDAAREHGYTPIGVSGGFEEVATRQADVWVDGGQLNEFEIGLLNSSFAANLVAIVAPDFASGQMRDRIAYNLDVLPEIAAAADAAPVLVFAHVPSPHQPTVFGENGAPVAVPLSEEFFADSPIERGEDPEEYRERYRAQLPVLNEMVLEAVDGIIDNAAEPPIIVLVADHGSASQVDWNATTPEDADPAQLLERTATLLATLTPGQPDAVPDDNAPVDLFSRLFDAYWGTDFGVAVPPPDGGQVEPIDASAFE
jgi:hypothetical protein